MSPPAKYQRLFSFFILPKIGDEGRVLQKFHCVGK